MDEQIRSDDQPRTGVVGRIFGTFFSPGATFASVCNSSTWVDWVAPLAITAIIGIVAAQQAGPIAMQEGIDRQREKIEQNTALSEDQKKKSLEGLEKAQTMGMGKIALVTAPVAALATLAILAGIYLGIANFLFRGTGSYLKAMAVTAYAGLIHSLEAVVLTPLIVMKNTANIVMGPALFLPQEQQHTWAYRLASGVDLFTIWYLVVVSIGVGAISGVSSKRVGSVIFPLWLIWVIAMAFVKNAFGG